MAPKGKSQKLSLGDFLSDQTLGSWADEMEDSMPVSSDARSGGFGGGERRTFSSNAGFGGDRGGDRGYARMDPSDRGYARQELPLPTKPPFTAHLGNLPFDVTNLDVEDFFAGCELSNIRIVEDKIERKPKGFGYVEFRSLDGLKKALELNGAQLNGRNVRISIAEPAKERQEMRVLDDWSRKGPLPELAAPQQQRRASDRGGFDMERGGSRRGPGGFEGEPRAPPREVTWERKGPLSPPPEAARGPAPNRVRDEVRERKASPQWGEARDGSRPPREYQERPERPERAERPPPIDRQPTAAEMDNQWRARMRPDAPEKSADPTPEPSAPASPAQPPPPASRPRLNLAKRTVSEAQPAEASAAGSSIFGGAKPIDTATREKEVGEKMELQLRQKKEAEEKAREEKKAAQEAAAKEAAQAGKRSEEKENGEADGEEGKSPVPKPGFQILSRMDEEGNAVEESDATAADAPANGNIVDDKAVKPREFTREPPTGPREQRGERGERGERGDRGGRGGRGGGRGGRGRGGGGGADWRDRKSSAPGTPKSPAPEVGGAGAGEMEDDGWSVVSNNKGPKGGKGRGNAGARAIAS